METKPHKNITVNISLTLAHISAGFLSDIQFIYFSLKINLLQMKFYNPSLMTPADLFVWQIACEDSHL